MSDTDKSFTGSIPKVYEEYLVPLIFQPYAKDLKERVAAARAFFILEIAAGTGVATRELANIDEVSIIATDLNQAMLNEAVAIGTTQAVLWQQADAMALPFPDNQFDAVVCQFGAMFFPDKSVAFSEARRVLKTDGVFIFSVWDRISENEFSNTITQALSKAFPEKPPMFLARTPHGYYDRLVIAQDLMKAGFSNTPQVDTFTVQSRAASAREPAIAYCQGTPLRNEIDPARLDEAVDVAEAAIKQKFGANAVEGKIQAHVITVRK